MQENDGNILNGKPRGFAGMLARQVEAINQNPAFKEDFIDQDELKFLLIAHDQEHAAILIIDHGQILVEGVKQDSKESISRDVLGWDAMVAASMQTYLELALGRLSFIRLGLKVIKGEVKVKKPLKLLKLQRIFEYLS
ncbi:hypothetical protein GF325_09500 [Candidatus Bathyarchaeota archaeon]|nr:hypothetical protein [Candidatus Bathyarchaeota archaeon]